MGVKERAGCFVWFAFLVSRDGCVALPHGTMGLSAVWIVVFPDHSHLLMLHYLSYELLI